MPTRAEHLDQARANRAHAERLLGESPTDPIAVQWAVTAAFYCAVHCLQAYLVGRGVRPRSHLQRDAYLADQRYGIPNHVYNAYKKLKRRSEGARYLLWRFTAADVRDDVLDRYLARITSFVGL